MTPARITSDRPRRLPHGQPARRHGQQRGVVLVVALIILVVMTMIGLVAMRSSTQEERMAAHSFDRSLSFQAAEAALRQGESVAEIDTTRPGMGAGCTAGVCGRLDYSVAGVSERWEKDGYVEDDWVDSAPINNGGIIVTPQYIVEYLGGNFLCKPDDLSSAETCHRYRVTARAAPGDGRAAVILQSIYAVE